MRPHFILDLSENHERLLMLKALNRLESRWAFELEGESMAFNAKDRFFHKAKAEGYLARSAYKLDEIQKKFRLLSSGDFVLDLGAAPGAWSQVACKVVGERGRVVGLDLKPVDFKAPNAEFYEMNVFDFKPEILGARMVDCLLSDMAPNTTGIRGVDQARSAELCAQVLILADTTLKTGGHLVMKLFEGPDAEKLAKDLARKFAQSKRLKPKPYARVAFETYFIG